MRFDDPIHLRLGKGRLIALIMAKAAVAENIQHHVFLKLHAVFAGDARSVHNRFGIVAVDMEDRRLDHFCDLGAIGARARIRWASGKSDLVVDDHMHRAARAVTFKFREIQALWHQPLTGKSRIAV